MIKKFIKKNYLIIIIVTLIIAFIFTSYYYYKKPIIVKPLYSDDSGFYITLQYELKEDYDLGEDEGKLFGKHSRTTLLDTGSMWIDIGSVMDKHDKKILGENCVGMSKNISTLLNNKTDFTKYVSYTGELHKYLASKYKVQSNNILFHKGTINFLDKIIVSEYIFFVLGKA